jgi:hypothetical protein
MESRRHAATLTMLSPRQFLLSFRTESISCGRWSLKWKENLQGRRAAPRAVVHLFLRQALGIIHMQSGLGTKARFTAKAEQLQECALVRKRASREYWCANIAAAFA